MRKKICPWVLILLGVMGFGCGASKSYSPADIAKIQAVFDLRSYRITCEWAMPMVTSALNQVGNSGLVPPGSSISRINLAGNANYVIVKGDSIKVALPYYGERQMGGGYDPDGGGINFEGIPSYYYVETEKSSGVPVARVRFQKQSESFEMTIRSAPDFSVDLTVNSNQRTSIRYEGRLVPSKE